MSGVTADDVRAWLAEVPKGTSLNAALNMIAVRAGNASMRHRGAAEWSVADYLYAVRVSDDVLKRTLAGRHR